ncbi:MAG: response regulator [Sphingomonadaceae bacterium]|nr:response regulator [Sphingomonadaceae bacterium]
MNLAGSVSARDRVLPLAVAGGALAITGGLLWWISGSAVTALAYAGAIAVLAGLALAGLRLLPAGRAEIAAQPDWSVTVEAIEREGEALAVTDRANRLVCANSAYRDWFGTSHAPPNLPVDRPSLEALARAAREAWRDGTGKVERLVAATGSGGWSASASRAGRGDDYLVWRLQPHGQDNLSEAVSGWLGGVFGLLLSRSGIEAATVSADGIIGAVTPGFGERAVGDASATLAGQEFVTHLRTDDRDRIYFAREGRRGAPQTLLQVPLGGAGDGGKSAADDAPSLMLLVDSGVGIGSWDGGGQAATPQLESLLEALPLGLAMTDRDGRFLFANPPFKRAAGLGEKDLPQYPSDLVVREDKGALADAVRRYGKGSAASGDVAVRLRANPEEPASLGLAGVRGLGEAAVLLSLVDSSEETRLKRQVAQATKMQAVGQLAGGVAHDFNNVLTAILGYCDLMLLRHTPGDSDYDDIQQIRANTNRAASLTRQLLAFSRQQTLRPEVLQLPDVVSEVSQLLKRLLGEKIELRVRHDRDLGPVRADPQQLEQVIVNLAVNARDAIHSRGGGKGRVVLSTRRVTAGDIRKQANDILPPDDYTVLVVQDNGGGIPPEAIGKIFEPFFTTKEQGKGGSMGGTGLGLSTVYGIVKQSGGFIFADNVAGPGGAAEGARFTVYLPVHRGPVAAPARSEPERPTSDWSGGGRILLVEDEDMVRAVAERALVRAGFTVVTASDGEEGLAAVANGGAFDLVVSDVVMPGMDGPAMARAIRKVRPDLPFLFMSGYAEAQLRDEIDMENMHFLAKPFNVQQIGEKVAMVMAGRPK